jgi:putative PIN family toxin of toxin-antitoxin system
VRLVVDTNVLVSGLLSPAGTPGRLVDGLLLGEFVPVVDDRILAEYAEVLARPRFRFDPARRGQVLDFLRASGEHIVAPPLSVVLPDPDDRAFLEVAHRAGVVALVTDNLHRFPDTARSGVRVCSPAEIVAEWAARPAGLPRPSGS